jgi:hypothetical protein
VKIFCKISDININIAYYNNKYIANFIFGFDEEDVLSNIATITPESIDGKISKKRSKKRSKKISKKRSMKRSMKRSTKRSKKRSTKRSKKRSKKRTL